MGPRRRATPSRSTTSGSPTRQGEEFDASWDRGDPLEFQLGAGRVIAGWDQGVQGMKVGGRRQLIIPRIWPTGTGPGNVIAPGETLIFVCDLVCELEEFSIWRTSRRAATRLNSRAGLGRRAESNFGAPLRRATGETGGVQGAAADDVR